MTIVDHIEVPRPPTYQGSPIKQAYISTTHNLDNPSYQPVSDHATSSCLIIIGGYMKTLKAIVVFDQHSPN